MCDCRDQFSQLQGKHEQLLSDYHDLLDETKADKVDYCVLVFVLSAACSL